jgi:hypothetical protein
MTKKFRPNTMPKVSGAKFLARVPAEYVFLCHDGQVFGDMRELAEGLVNMSDETYTYHVNPEKNDFNKWVRDVIKDRELADDLAKATIRQQAIGYMTSRISSIISRV